MKLETNRLVLRPIHLNDANEIFEYRSDSETNKYQGWIPKTIEEVVAFIEKNPKKSMSLNLGFNLSSLRKRPKR